MELLSMESDLSDSSKDTQQIRLIHYKELDVKGDRRRLNGIVDELNR